MQLDLIHELVPDDSIHKQANLAGLSIVDLNLQSLCDHNEPEGEDDLSVNGLFRAALIVKAYRHLDFESLRGPLLSHVEQQAWTTFQSVFRECQHFGLFYGIPDPNVATRTGLSIDKCLSFVAIKETRKLANLIPVGLQHVLGQVL